MKETLMQRTDGTYVAVQEEKESLLDTLEPKHWALLAAVLAAVLAAFTATLL